MDIESVNSQLQYNSNVNVYLIDQLLFTMQNTHYMKTYMYKNNKTGKIAGWEAAVTSATESENNLNKKCEIVVYCTHQ